MESSVQMEEDAFRLSVSPSSVHLCQSPSFSSSSDPSFSPSPSFNLGSSDEIPPPKEVTYKAYIWSWFQILVIPYLLWSTYIFYPYQKSQKGLGNNWIFMFFAMPLGSLWVIAVYGYWGKVFLGTVYKAPVVVTTIVLTVTYWIVCQFVFPVTLLGLVVILVLTVFFPATLLICLKKIDKRDDENTKAMFKAFSLFRLMIAALFAICCIYVVLFNKFYKDQAIQRTLIVVFTAIVFVLKLFVQDFTRRNVDYRYSSLVVFYLEFFYEFFNLSIFPNISSISTYVIIIVLKFLSMSKSIALLSDLWWGFRNKALQFQRLMELKSADGSTTSMDPEIQKDFTKRLYRRSQIRMYTVMRRVVFSDLNHDQLRDYIALNFFYSCVVHVLCPLYWIPMSYFIKHGYNKEFFTYYFFTDSEYRLSVIFASISFGVSLIVMIVAFIVLLKYFDVNFVKVSKRYIVEDKWCFILIIISTATICWSIASEQHNIAWYFIDKNKNNH